jgi:hypothetical protein
MDDDVYEMLMSVQSIFEGSRLEPYQAEAIH